MNRTILPIALVVLLVGSFGTSVLSQTAPAPKTPLELLHAMKAKNQATLDKQAALLLKLDELQKEAAQVKFLSKRG
jgi:hypothetical protein